MLKRNIPNFFTLLNLLSGCIGIVFAFQGNLVWSSYLIGAAALFDFLDGFLARMLNVKSEIGKQLDSLADMVTFGVLPGVMMYKLIIFAKMTEIELSHSYHDLVNDTCFFCPDFYLPAFIAFLIPVFSAIRLAKFNIDERQSESFIGLPTPANAIFIASLPLVLSFHFGQSGFPSALGWTDSNALFPSVTIGTLVDISFLNGLLSTVYCQLAIVLIFSFLLVAPIPLFAFKFKSFSWKGNQIRYLFLAMSAGLLVLFGFAGISFSVILYILLSVVSNLLKKSG